MIVLGVDPGTARTGFGVIKYQNYNFKALSAGCIESSSSLPTADRLKIIATKLQKIIQNYKPEVLAIEKIFFSKNIKTAISVAESRGVVLLLASQNKLKIKEFKPTEVKQAVSGVGNASKEQVQKMVALMLNLKQAPKLDDTADALACAIAASSK